MNKKEIVISAIKGENQSYVPAGFSLHFPPECASGENAVKAHLDFFEKTDTDILKIMNENLVPDFGEITTPDDWNKIPKLSINDKFMQQQIDTAKKILDKADSSRFVVGTVHGICASAIHPIESRYGYQKVRELMCTHLRENKKPVLEAFKRITHAMCQLVEEYKKIGLDGIYYAALGGEKHFFTTDEFNEAILPFDKEILSASKEVGLYNFLHICKENIDMQRYKSYNDVVDVVNWGVFETEFSLEEGKKLFPNATIMGGLPNRGGAMMDGSPEDIIESIENLIKTQNRKDFILGADCTLPSDISYERINAVVKAARNI